MALKVKDSRFLLSAESRKSWPPEGLPEVAFGGRSNVGKSSLINSLLGRKGLARTSSTPGRTQSLNFIDVDLAAGATALPLRICDLPGYGYAKASKKARKAWGNMIETYLSERPSLALVVSLVDARHPPTVLDQQMVAWLHELGRPFIIVATKLDKLPKAKRAGVLVQVAQGLGLEPGQVLGFSSVSGDGRDQLLRRLAEVASAPAEP